VWIYYPRKSRKQKKQRIKQETEIQTYYSEENKSGESTTEDKVKAVLIQRINGIKYKNVNSIINLIDGKKYTKFDDWPPFERQNINALKREAEAFKILKNYDYEVTNWAVNIFGDTSLVSFTINYQGIIRKLKFNIRSRVTAFLIKQDGKWKLIHEHWSRFPEQIQKKEEWWKP
jgi:hypothetical protein